jgi:hypothetical protein
MAVRLVISLNILFLLAREIHFICLLVSKKQAFLIQADVGN